MTGFLSPDILPTPVAPNSAPYEWQRAVKIFEGNNVATLETAINNWIMALKGLQPYAAILDVVYIGQGTGTNVRVLIDYGYFTAP